MSPELGAFARNVSRWHAFAHTSTILFTSCKRATEIFVFGRRPCKLRFLYFIFDKFEDYVYLRKPTCTSTRRWMVAQKSTEKYAPKIMEIRRLRYYNNSNAASGNYLRIFTGRYFRFVVPTVFPPARRLCFAHTEVSFDKAPCTYLSHTVGSTSRTRQNKRSAIHALDEIIHGEKLGSTRIVLTFFSISRDTVHDVQGLLARFRMLKAYGVDGGDTSIERENLHDTSYYIAAGYTEKRRR